MSEQPYEIELVRCKGEDWVESMLATITGLTKKEIRRKLPAEMQKPGGWRGSWFPRAARLLGFSTTDKFRKWDAGTPWPCVMRVQVPEAWGWKGRWWALIYNQGLVYSVNAHQYVPSTPGVSTLAEWQEMFPGCRVTSMLQIWMSTSQTLSHSDQ